MVNVWKNLNYLQYCINIAAMLEVVTPILSNNVGMMIEGSIRKSRNEDNYLII